MRFVLLSLLVVLLVASTVAAAPQIDAIVSGSFVDGQSVAIDGSSFGTKAHGPPLRWLDFDDGQNNNLLNEDGWLLSYDTDTWCAPHYSLENSRDGSLSGMFCGERTSDGYEYQQLGTNHMPITSTKMFVSGYLWFDWGSVTSFPGSTAPLQIKTWRLHSGGGLDSGHLPWFGNQNNLYQDGEESFRITNREENCPELSDGDMRIYYQKYNNRAWNSYQLLFDSGTHDNFDGSAHLIINNDLMGDNMENYRFYCGADAPIDNFLLGYYMGNLPTSYPAEGRAHYDDVYVDDTWSRIELCDAPTKESANVCEMQIPQMWDVDSIQFEVNYGSFTPADDVYLIVFNHDNEASNGFAIAAEASTDPYITDVIGTLSHGSSLTISGQNFGVKSPVEPWIWDDFEVGIQHLGEEVVAVNPEWTTAHESHTYTDEYSHSGSLSAVKDSRAFHNLYPVDKRPTDTMYMTGWVKTRDWIGNDAGSQYATAVKFFRMNNGDFPLGGLGPPPYNGPLSHNFGDDVISREDDLTGIKAFATKVSPAVDNSGNSGDRVTNFYTLFNYNSDWQRLEHFSKLNTPGIADGQVYSRNVGIDADEDNAVMQRYTDSTLQLDIPLFMTATANSNADKILPIWGDDFYADITQARIEIGDEPYFLQSNHREIQIPHTTWNNNQIQFTVNLGSFTEQEIDEDLYLFVIDADGVASPGFCLNPSGCTYVPPPPPVCDNDGRCDSGEDISNCPSDCGSVVECFVDLDCDDGVSCTVDSCVSDVCENVPSVEFCSLSDGLELYLPFDNSVVDLSGRDRSFVSVDGGVSGYGISPVDGFSAYFSGGALDFGLWDLSGDSFTLSSWVRVDSSTDPLGSRFVSKASSSSEADHFWMLGEYENSWRARLKTDVGDTLGPVGSLVDDVWYHVVTVYDGSSWSLFVDGSLLLSKARTGDVAVDSSVPVFVGSNSDGYGLFRGALDDLRVYDRALSVDELADLYAFRGELPAEFCSDGVCNADEDYFSCSLDCDPTIQDFTNHVFNTLLDLVLFGRDFN